MAQNIINVTVSLDFGFLNHRKYIAIGLYLLNEKLFQKYITNTCLKVSI